MQAKQEKKASANDRQQQNMLDHLGDLAKQNKAAYQGALDDFRSSFTLQHTMSFSTEAE
jgi:hypothetical protein